MQIEERMAEAGVPEPVRSNPPKDAQSDAYKFAAWAQAAIEMQMRRSEFPK